MDWSSATSVLASTKRPKGYELERLARADVPRLVVSLAAWYPDIVVGAESCHLDEAFYYEETSLSDDDDKDRSILPVVAKSRRKRQPGTIGMPLMARPLLKTIKSTSGGNTSAQFHVAVDTRPGSRIRTMPVGFIAPPTCHPFRIPARPSSNVPPRWEIWPGPIPISGTLM
jgi:hypothetical protein